MASANMSNRRCSDVFQRKGKFKLIDYSDPNTPASADISIVEDEAEGEVEQREQGKSVCTSKHLRKSSMSSSVFALMEFANQVSGSNPNTPVSSHVSMIEKEASNKKKSVPQLKYPRWKASTSITPPIKSALADFTDAQKLSHFNFCMKLSLENKITTKNAFSLHLIDFFSDNVKQGGEPNFQMASLTLDASARIYAVRVDCLHAAAVKMAMGLHANTISAKGKGSVDKENDTGTSEEQDTAKLKNKKKKKRIFASSTTKSMKIAKLEKEDEPHEKFGFIKGIFNAAKCGGLLTSCNVISDKFDISFVEAHVYNHQKKKQDVNYMADRVVIGATKRILSPVINDDVNINADDGDFCVVPTMESFSFLKKSWSHDTSFSGLHADEESNSSSEEENSSTPVLRRKKMKSSDVEEQSSWFLDQCNIDFDNRVQDIALNSLFEQVLVMPNDGDSVFDDANDTFCSTPAPAVRDSFLMPPPKTPPSRCVFDIPDEPRTALKSFRNSYLNPPLPCPQMSVQGAIDSLFKMGIDPVVDAALSGRCHMKMKKVVQHISKKTTGPAQKKRNLRITFEEKCEVVNKKTSQGKRNKFTSNYVNKWMISDTLLPSFSYDETDFFKTFITELFLNKIPVYDEAESVLDRSIGYDHVHDSSDNEEDANANKPYEAWEVDYEECLSSLNDLQLVPKPEMVKKETVKYSRQSKNIDQKRVKATIWSIISRHYCVEERTQGIDDSDMSEKNQKLESEFENVTPAKCPDLTFYRMYRTLMDVLPMSVKEQMSMSIAFVALLHLANEKNLNLEQKEEEFDFRIFMT